MLKDALIYKSELEKHYIKMKDKEDYYKYFVSADYWYKLFDLDESEYNSITKVSLNSNNEVIGFFRAGVEHNSNFIRNMAIIHFTTTDTFTFSKDLAEFIEYLFIYRKFNKINWTVYSGNPAKHMYDKFIKQYNGRVVGIKYEEIRLLDGTICDKTIYELMRKDYITARHIK